MSRPQLFAMTHPDTLGVRDSLQPWMRVLLEESAGTPALVYLEQRASDVVTRAGAEIPSQRPCISVKRLAHFLGAHVEVASGESTATFPEGTLERAGPLAWRVVVTKPTYSAYRFTIAHELGHTLLYRHGGEFDARAWQSSTASPLEEAIANYLGRFLLAPDHLIVPRIREYECAADFVYRVLMDEFGLPLRQAIVRWLDVSDRLNVPAVGGLIWEQYHAFDPARTAPVVASVGLGRRAEFAALLERVRHECGTDDKTKGSAELIWRDARAAATSGAGPLLESSLPPILEELRANLRSLMRDDHQDALRLAIEHLCGAAPHLALRPEWHALRDRCSRDFVPCKRGHARPGSLVASIAVGSTDNSNVGEEDLAVGTLVGRFRVHVAARGSWTEGTRRIVQLLTRSELG
ncbi:MAG: ImmA/IrrE family metallo-endopeptidase [Phycisphaerales bacterium]